MSNIVYVWPGERSIEEFSDVLAMLIGSEEFTGQMTVPIPKQIAAMIGELYAFQLTEQGHIKLKTGIMGPGPFIDWPLSSPFENLNNLIDLQWESRIWPPLNTLNDLIGLRLRRIPSDSPTKDLVPDRVTFHVNKEGRITSFDQG